MGDYAIPEGMEIPEDLKPGETFDALATVKLNEDGTITVVSLDGHDLPTASREKEKAVTPEELGFMESVKAGMA